MPNFWDTSDKCSLPDSKYTLLVNSRVIATAVMFLYRTFASSRMNSGESNAVQG